eukprot:CAMPEP_0171157102 /NCGR_PEP_ID=MMETSP0790-20130122/1789_1 /TAXON_ID=2925 /ORGANISM="Alexandrium catenella, Strain OF101" /LENGTH=257 /DNA_ID=CAMNT_0011621435 /DNA_START=11 /DNA_END=786 /DNA_ORIENTATION=-
MARRHRLPARSRPDPSLRNCLVSLPNLAAPSVHRLTVSSTAAQMSRSEAVRRSTGTPTPRLTTALHQSYWSMKKGTQTMGTPHARASCEELAPQWEIATATCCSLSTDCCGTNCSTRRSWEGLSASCGSNLCCALGSDQRNLNLGLAWSPAFCTGGLAGLPLAVQAEAPIALQSAERPALADVLWRGSACNGGDEVRQVAASCLVEDQPLALVGGAAGLALLAAFSACSAAMASRFSALRAFLLPPTSTSYLDTSRM